MDNVLRLENDNFDDDSFDGNDFDRGFSKSSSFLHGMRRAEVERIMDLTDDSLVKKRKNEARNHGAMSTSLNKARVKGELASYAKPMTIDEKVRVIERFAADFEPFFYHHSYRDGDFSCCGVPQHPWTTLKQVREEMGGANELSLDERYALRFTKTKYAELWRGL